MIAHKLGTAALMKVNQFYFRMIVPAVINIGQLILTDTEGMNSAHGDFQQLWFHGI
jgi:hypothetical protein